MNRVSFFIAIGTFIFSLGIVGFFVLSQNSSVAFDEVLQSSPMEIKSTKNIQDLPKESDVAEISDEIKNTTEEHLQGELKKENELSSQQIEEESLFHFAVMGDSEREKSPYGFDEESFLAMDKIVTMNPDLVFFTGDIITVGSDPRGERVSINNAKKVIDSYFSQIPYYITLGHHDVECGTKCIDLWQEIFFDKVYTKNEERISYYDFDYQNTHFILLSTDYPTKRTIDSKQMQWLENSLKNNEKENTIVLMHVPPVTFFKESAKDCHDFGCQPQLQKQLQSLFEKNGVDLVIAGHEQAFDHKIVNGVDYILSGNSTDSKPRYKNVEKGQTFSDVIVRNKTIVVKGIDVSKGVIREIRIK